LAGRRYPRLLIFTRGLTGSRIEALDGEALFVTADELTIGLI
jgi:hypothetical protein